MRRGDPKKSRKYIISSHSLKKITRYVGDIVLIAGKQSKNKNKKKTNQS